MLGLLIALSAALVTSFGINVFQHFKRKHTKRTQSIELKDFLHDLTAGQAIVSITRLDPDYLMMRSPRNDR